MKEIAKIFLRLGAFGFGGPIAVMAMIEEEVCRKRRWLSSEKFSEVYAVLKLFPGPISTQMAIYVGSARAGIAGGVLAGVAYILPAFLLVLVLGYFYVRSQIIGRFSTVFSGMQIGALAVVFLSTWQLSGAYRKSARSWAIAAVSAALVVYSPRWEPLIILAFGLVGVARARALSLPKKPPNMLFSAFLLPVQLASLAAFKNSVLAKLFWVCFKAGAFVFGTGLAIVPLLEADVVGFHGWLTHNEFMDALVIGQVTPGPVVITATFIGYKVAGLAGSAVATIGVFVPSFINVLFIFPRTWKRLSGTPVAGVFLSWAVPAVIGGILGATLRLGWVTLSGPLMIVEFLILLVAMIWFRLPAWAMVLVGAGVGCVGGVGG